MVADAAAQIAPLLRRPRVVVVTDETVSATHLGTNPAGLGEIEMVSLALPAGRARRAGRTERCVEFLLEQKVERKDIVTPPSAAGDRRSVGFAAAVLRRGVRFVQIPTTLLAQVDSLVGGKTGINTAQGKNLVGAFHQPSLVLADIGLLDTLPARDFLAGYGEVVKYGLWAMRVSSIGWRSTRPKMAAGDHAARHYAVKRSVEMKAEIVARDETEEGDRALAQSGPYLLPRAGKSYGLFGSTATRRGGCDRLCVGV